MFKLTFQYCVEKYFHPCKIVIVVKRPRVAATSRKLK